MRGNTKPNPVKRFHTFRATCFPKGAKRFSTISTPPSFFVRDCSMIIASKIFNRWRQQNMRERFGVDPILVDRLIGDLHTYGSTCLLERFNVSTFLQYSRVLSKFFCHPAGLVSCSWSISAWRPLTDAMIEYDNI